KLNLPTSAEVASAFTAIEAAAAGALDGILVQPQIKGTRELVAGMIRDPQFGPCVMFGLGGIFTEVLDDVSFRIAPLRERDALAMVDSIRGSAILGPVRGTAAADRSALAGILITLGRIGLENDSIDAIDVNPLLLQEDGTPVAVDAAIWTTR
ncbi:MAG: carboxylate--amine ligase, partial [Acidobacteria bacterium]|nr:carboxylate--amine ligase [Acidobacteriota bacterium]